ncbi:MAG: polyprenol monophosphomannose synthase [Thermodesulfobacteriota bacterium]|nr:polyprenol monophosphomannose synthase [Thermodesulfobacteriota bacterium]
MKTYIVIPTFNEAKNLEKLVDQILALHPGFNIIVVDDNSPDGTGQIADDLALKYPRLSVIHRAHKAGLGSAYLEGFKVAIGKKADLIMEMDADLSHDPAYIKNLIKASEEADLVIGSRYINGVRVEGWRFRRLLLSKLANIFVSFVVVRPVWDFTAGFRCYRRAVLETIDLDRIRSDGYAFQIELTCLAFKHSFKVCEVPIIFREREHGYSKISRKVVREAFWITLKCHAPWREIWRHLPFLFKDYNEFVEKA